MRAFLSRPHTMRLQETTGKNYDSQKRVPKIQLHLPVTLIWCKAFLSSEWNESI